MTNCLRTKDDTDKFSCQVVCLAAQVEFTQQCEECLQQGTLRILRIELAQRLKSLTTRGTTSHSNLGLNIKALMLDAIHAIDVIDHLVLEHATQPDDWAWFRQVRTCAPKNCTMMSSQAPGNECEVVYIICILH